MRNNGALKLSADDGVAIVAAGRGRCGNNPTFYLIIQLKLARGNL